MTKPDKKRADRLATALRENLRKRKAQARAAEGTTSNVPAKGGTQTERDSAS